MEEFNNLKLWVEQVVNKQQLTLPPNGAKLKVGNIIRFVSKSTGGTKTGLRQGSYYKVVAIRPSVLSFKSKLPNATYVLRSCTSKGKEFKREEFFNVAGFDENKHDKYNYELVSN